MECNGICNDDEAAYFKVSCPGILEDSTTPFFSYSIKNLPHKLKISQDGRANKEYKDICQKAQHKATVAYNNYATYFEIDDNDKMIEYPIQPRTGVRTTVSYDYEILSSFFEFYHITPTWINCNYNWGWFDEETGHWTGAVGKVVKWTNKI